MARTVVCLGVLAVAALFAVPASAQPKHSGYIAITKLQIDPRMAIMSDAPQKASQPQQQPQAQSAPGAQDNRDNGMPLDQSDASDGQGPAGDDPFADNAVETDTVYTI